MAPPELAADILIRMVESGRVIDPAWTLDLLDQVFQMNAHIPLVNHRAVV